MQEQLFKLIVKNLVIPSRIGIHQHERLAPQKIRINVELSALEIDDLNDDYDKALCYAELITRIKGVAGSTHFNLVETLAEEIAKDCLNIEEARSVLVRIEKLEQFKDAESVGVEIVRTRTKNEREDK